MRALKTSEERSHFFRRRDVDMFTDYYKRPSRFTKEYSEARQIEGKWLEIKVFETLWLMKHNGLIRDAILHKTNGYEDSSGWDFTVELLNGFRVSFGVSCSRRAVGRYKIKHPGQEVFVLDIMQSWNELEGILKDLVNRLYIKKAAVLPGMLLKRSKQIE